jgi:hypothetical protein
MLTQRPVSPAAETYEHDVDIVKRALNGLVFAVFGREVSFAHGESLRERQEPWCVVHTIRRSDVGERGQTW